MDEKEKAFFEVAQNLTENARYRVVEFGNKVLENPPIGFQETTIFNNAGEQYAWASELTLKANIIFDDFKKNARFNEMIGTKEWYNLLAGRDTKLKIISGPKEIRKLILENNPQDERSQIETEPRFNADFKTLSHDNTKPTGHSLYAYYQLQSPLAKSLINAEYYCYVEDEAKYTVYALLTDDILSSSIDGRTIMPKEMMEKLDSVKEAAVDLRYSAISLENVTREELIFLKEFSTSLVNIGEYRFASKNRYAEFNIRKKTGIPLFERLDGIVKYYIQTLFNKREIESLVNYTSLLEKEENTIDDLFIFINNCVYFKHFIEKRMEINLEFTEKQYGRIDRFCKLIKAFQPFNPEGKRLCDNDAFSTDEKKDYYKREMNKRRKILFKVRTDEGKEMECELLYVHKENPKTKKNYIIYTNHSSDDEGNTLVYSSIYDTNEMREEPEKDYVLMQLYPVETEEDKKIVEQIIKTMNNGQEETVEKRIHR